MQTISKACARASASAPRPPPDRFVVGENLAAPPARGTGYRRSDRPLPGRILDESPALALRFVDALEQACRHIQKHPATGSPRHAHELNIPGLRCWPLKRFPYLVFYCERADTLEIWRVLHGRRDIPAWLTDTAE